MVVRKPERAVLTDDAAHRPEARNHVAPSGRTAGDRNDGKATRGQFLQRRIGGGAQLPVARHRVVDVGQHRAHAPRRIGGKFRKRSHHFANFSASMRS
jgi:hypothetical protein